MKLHEFQFEDISSLRSYNEVYNEVLGVWSLGDPLTTLEAGYEGSGSGAWGRIEF